MENKYIDLDTLKRINSHNISSIDLNNVILNKYIKKVSLNNVVYCYTSIENFKKKFKITSDILDDKEHLFKNRAILAGGKMIDFFENKTKAESNNDYDLFFLNRHNLRNHTSKNSNIIISNLLYVKEYIYDYKKYQIITKIYSSIEEIIESFDFRCCSIASDGKYIFWIKGCLRDIKNKKIVILNQKKNTSIFNRIFKYKQKGYDISLPDLAMSCINFNDSLIKNLTSKKHKNILLDRNAEYEREETNYYNL